MHSYYLNVQRVGNISVNVYSFLCKHILSLNQIKSRSARKARVKNYHRRQHHSNSPCRIQNRIVAVRVSVPTHVSVSASQAKFSKEVIRGAFGMSRVTARSTRRQPATLLPQKMVSGSGSEEVRLSEMEVDTAHVYTYHHCHDHLQYSNSHF